jgi:hypothetical protein
VRILGTQVFADQFTSETSRPPHNQIILPVIDSHDFFSFSNF